MRWTCEVPVAIRKMPVISIAAVNGPAVGAGFGLGRRIHADEAKELGIAWRVSETPLDDAIEYATVLAAQAARASIVTRQALYRSEDLDVETEVLIEEARSQGVALRSAEFEERFAAYQSGIVGTGTRAG